MFINPENTKLTGYTLNDLTAISGAEFFALFHPEDQPRVAAHMQRVVKAEDGEVLEIDYRFKAADGRWIWCFSRDTILEREADGSVRQLIGTFLDISKRKTVEMDLLTVTRQQEETLALMDAIFESAPIGLVFCDRNLRFVKLNRTLAEINGRAFPVLVTAFPLVRELRDGIGGNLADTRIRITLPMSEDKPI